MYKGRTHSGKLAQVYLPLVLFREEYMTAGLSHAPPRRTDSLSYVVCNKIGFRSRFYLEVRG